jgi:hypothetical protein
MPPTQRESPNWLKRTSRVKTKAGSCWAGGQTASIVRSACGGHQLRAPRADDPGEGTTTAEPGVARRAKQQLGGSLEASRACQVTVPARVSAKGLAARCGPRRTR